MKRNSKEKAGKLKKYIFGTGGGPRCSEILNENDDRIINIIGSGTVTGHIDVPETPVEVVLLEGNLEEVDVNLQSPVPQDLLLPVPEHSSPVPHNATTDTQPGKPKKKISDATKAFTNLEDTVSRKLDMKQQYYEAKLNVLNNQMIVECEMLELRKEEISLKRAQLAVDTRIANALQDIANKLAENDD